MEVLLNLVNHKLNGQTTMTEDEIKRLINECFSITALGSTERTKFHINIIEGIKSQIINPTVLMFNALPHLRTLEDLILIALCLRNGANANVYVELQRVGTVHILIYIAFIHRSSSSLKYILTLFTLFGSSFEFNAFETKTISSETPKTVARWMEESGIRNVSSQSLLDNLTVEEKILIGTMADKVEYGVIPENRVAELDFILSCRADSIINVYPKNKELSAYRKQNGDYGGIRTAINHYSPLAFVKFAEAGESISYMSLNHLCFEIQNEVGKSNIHVVNALVNILKEAVKRGALLDSEQIAIISTSSESIVSDIIELYQTPRWKKMCYTSTSYSNSIINEEVPQLLKYLAFNLSIDPTENKGEICESLNLLSKSNAETLIEAARVRQSLRVSVGLSSISDFIGRNGPESAICANRTSLQKDPFLYNDATLSYYKDDNSNIWCFTSEMYDRLLKDGVNPYQKEEKLPESFLNQIQAQINVFKKYGISYSEPMNVEESVAELSKADKINNEESQKAYNTFEKIILYYNITTEDIKRSSANALLNCLSYIHLDPKYFSQMTQKHKLFTFARAALTEIQINETFKNTFFLKLRNLRFTS